MISLFLGLSAANLIIMCTAAGLGLFAAHTAAPTSDTFTQHITIGIASGLLTTLTHTTVYAYFMATSKWLGAATDKADLDRSRFIAPAVGHKHRVLLTVLVAIAASGLTMFSGAAADSTVRPWLPGEAHLATAAGAVMVNAIACLQQFRLIRQQGRLMDEALAILNRTTDSEAHRAERF